MIAVLFSASRNVYMTKTMRIDEGAMLTLSFCLNKYGIQYITGNNAETPNIILGIIPNVLKQKTATESHSILYFPHNAER
jgi:hypothetical protein